MAEPKWIPDLQSSRIFWLQLEHFDLDTTCGVWPERIQFQLLSAYDVVAAPGWCIGTPRQPWCEIWLIREGQVEVIQDEISATVRAGEIAILTGGRSRLSTESIGVPLSLIGFSCDAKIWNALDFIALLDLPLQVKPNAIVHQVIAGNLQLLLDECRTSDRLGELAAHALAQTVFVQVLRTIFSKEDFEKSWRKKLPAALSPEIAGSLAFIADHFSEHLDLHQLARAAHLSPKYFARKFKAAISIAPMEYVRRIRMERAQSLLAASDAAVGQIALSCGFEDAAHFSRAFKTYSGSTPLEFRRHAQAFSDRALSPETKYSHPTFLSD